MYKASLYKKVPNGLNIDILNRIKEIDEKKDVADMDFWREQYQFCKLHSNTKDINALSEHLMSLPQFPQKLAESMVLGMHNQALLLLSIQRKETMEKLCLNFVMMATDESRIKKLLKNHTDRTSCPISMDAINYIIETHPSTKYDGYQFRYVQDESLIKNKLENGELCENALSELINNPYMSDEIRQIAIESGCNPKRLLYATEKEVDLLLDSAISTIFEFNSKEADMKEPRKIAADTIRYMISKDMLSEKQQEKLYNICFSTPDRGNNKTVQSIFSYLLPKTTSEDILKKSYNIHTFENPRVNPDRTDNMIIHTIENRAKYKKKGANYIAVMEDLMALYSYKRNDVGHEVPNTQKMLIEKYLMPQEKETPTTSHLWLLYAKIASNPVTSNEYLKYIADLSKRIGFATNASMMATITLKLKDHQYKNGWPTDDDIRKMMIFAQPIFIKPELTTPEGELMKGILEEVVVNPQFKPYKYMMKQKISLIEEMQKKNHMYHESFFTKIEDDVYGYRMDIKQFNELSKEQQQKYFDKLSNKMLRELEDLLVHQLRENDNRKTCYETLIHIEPIMEKISDVIKARRPAKEEHMIENEFEELR